MSLLPGLVPGLGIVKGMALTLRRFFAPKATIMYPEMPADVAVRFRGRLQLLYDEYGALKCETCFQCAQACPIECIDMGGMDTKGRFHVHWGPPETYGERREESALRRSGRAVPDQAFEHFATFDLTTVDAILDEYDYDPKRLLQILEATQAAFGHLPVAALKRISEKTGQWYAMIYGTASYYGHLRFETPASTAQAAEVSRRRPSDDAYLTALGASVTGTGSTRRRRGPAAATPGARTAGTAKRGGTAGKANAAGKTGTTRRRTDA